MIGDINFRGLDIHGKWRYGLVAESAGFPGQPEPGVYISNTVGFPWAFQVRIETVGQYTDKHDDSRNEVYDGDIVEWSSLNAPEGKHIGEITFFEGCWFIQGDDANGPLYDCLTLEVIGNIHDDPDLLKAEL